MQCVRNIPMQLCSAEITELEAEPPVGHVAAVDPQEQVNFFFLLVLFVLHLQSTQQAIIVLPYRHKKYIKQIRNGNWSEMSLRQSLVGRQKTRAR